MQGVVNNAYYHNLLEQTRTEFLESVGIDRAHWSRQLGVDFVVYETSIQYRSPIQAGETFISGLNLRREGARFIHQQEFRHSDGTLCIKARVDVVVGIQGKLTRGDYFADYLAGKIQLPVTSGVTQRSATKIPEDAQEMVFDYEMKVRDYQCNRFGSATNVYVQHFLEETRLEFMEEMGSTFREWHERGIDMMVSRIDLKFIRPMMSSEKFHSLLNITKDGPRASFHQEIRRERDNKICVRALVDVVALVNGELSMGEPFEDFIETCKKNGVKVGVRDQLKKSI